MRIKEITHQGRRDLYGNLECEGCGAVEKFVGYDDRNYHDNVLPARECKSCGKSRNDLGLSVAPTPTKYPDWQQV